MSGNIYSVEYDGDFKRLRDENLLNWFPWVGINYPELPVECKVLIIGESHYNSEVEITDNSIEKYNYTRKIVGSLGVDANKSKSNFYKNTVRLMIGKDTMEKQERIAFWKNVCFYNFIQRPMADSKKRPTIEDLETGGKSLMDLITLLQPATCIFLGLAAADHLNEILLKSDYKIEKEIGKVKPIKKNHPRMGKILNSDGQLIKLLFVKHPSKYFSPDSWNAFLNKNASSPMAWFRALIS
jgi:hypothetical protein